MDFLKPWEMLHSERKEVDKESVVTEEDQWEK